jgi:hypothetical protein
VDPGTDVLYGPNPLQKSGTVSVPRELLREVGLDTGDRVHWTLSREVPGALILVPSKMVERIMPAVIEALRHTGQ